MLSLEARMVPIVGPDAVDEALTARCEACGEVGLAAFYESKSVPSQSCVLLDSKEESERYATGDVLLSLCERCGFIQNVRFDAGLVNYSKPTEESQAFSGTFTRFAEDLADRLVDHYALRGRTVLEVGCGKGDFLRLLGDRGIGFGLGIDPGFLPNRGRQSSVPIEFIKDHFGPDFVHLTADLVITRHLMEHIPNVEEFFGWLGDSVELTPGAALFTEVPDARRVLIEGAFWDVYYEHCSYFTRGSLARSLTSSGFEVDWMESAFANQYLLAGASRSKSFGRSRWAHLDSPTEMARLVEQFATDAAGAISRWRTEIVSILEDGGQVAIWGGGSKAVSFLSALGVGDITVVDINPHKQGKWLPGVGVEVHPPSILAETRPTAVIAMNRVYLPEIVEDLQELALEPRLFGI